MDATAFLDDAVPPKLVERFLVALSEDASSFLGNCETGCGRELRRDDGENLLLDLRGGEDCVADVLFLLLTLLTLVLTILSLLSVSSFADEGILVCLLLSPVPLGGAGVMVSQCQS